MCQMLQMPVVGAQTSLPGEERGLPCYCSFQGLCTESCPPGVHLHSLPLPGKGQGPHFPVLCRIPMWRVVSRLGKVVPVLGPTEL